MDGASNLFQFVACWYFITTGQCEPIAISRPVPLVMCERAQLKVRKRRSRLIHAYCL